HPQATPSMLYAIYHSVRGRSMKPGIACVARLLISFELLSAGLSAATGLRTLQPAGAVHEEWIDSPPVGSPRVLAGAFRGSLTDAADLRTLSIALPAARPANTVCLWVVSRDGRYSASATYNMTGFGPGEHRLEFPSKYAAKLRNATAATLTA